MRCYYEVLNVPRDAEDCDIKGAYKKLALRWHPDKNLSKPDEAKEQFQLVQQAYEVLSDRQERAWYDNHREQILHGSNKDFEDNCLDVFQFFTSSCYKGFGDDDDGFYSIYRNVFEQIAKEDMEHMDNKDEFTSVPMFGYANSDYESVVRPFYAFWMSYSTKRSYVWLDPYDIKETRDRRVVKLIEKENKKVRTKAKKERNEEVRNLIAFVRKRDKRVQANVKLLEQKAMENKLRAQELAMQARRDRMAESRTQVQAEWSKFDNVEEELTNIEKQLAEEFDDEPVHEEEIDDLYCVACNKVFKTPKAFANHESSKKHKENFELLKKEMLEYDELETLNEKEDDDIGSVSETNEAPINGHLENKPEEDTLGENVADVYADDELAKLEQEGTKSKKKKTKKNKTSVMVSDDETDLKSWKLRRKNTSSEQEEGILEHPEVDLSDNAEGNSADNDNEKVTQKKPKRRKGKNNQGEPGAGRDEGNIAGIDRICVTCKNAFSSKNKLFDHLKKTGHGVYIPPEQKIQEKGRGKKSKREERRRRNEESD